VIELQPFAPHQEKFMLSGELAIPSPGKVRIDFSLLDPERKILNAPTEAHWLNPTRVHGLWKNTCFEAFFSLPGEQRYWELNLSAAGEWNLYHFDSYRKPQPPQESSDFFIVDFQVTLNGISCLLEGTKSLSNIEASLCAVVQTCDQSFYYSTHHVGEKPDFHRRESFSLKRGIQ